MCLLMIWFSRRIGLLQTRREYVHVGSGAAFMRHTVLHNPIRLLKDAERSRNCKIQILKMLIESKLWMDSSVA
jgi:hypothetical protein